ncbi:hypothetical protein HF086_007520 [Spodoptera exigua]|uniref:TBC1 domain-containing protein n=1 Tax=Spodoptera exigua TaxID=7107 RepID=A0A922M2R0_SPOEX|nr:hypothetical protein HF086_007520 [Spodoptera exigua]
MGGGAGAVWEAGDSLVARVVAFGSAPELPRLRSLHRYRVAPPAPPTSAPIYHPPLHSAMQSMTKRGLRLFYSEDEGDSSDDGNKMALATFVPRREDRLAAGDRLSLDIGALKRQYARLRERQRQAHVILAAACARHAAVQGVPTSPTSLTVNNLLLGKSALVSSRGRRLGPPPGAIPPSRQTSTHEKSEPRSRQSADTISWNEEKSRKTLSRRNSVKWKDIKKDKVKQKERKASIDLDEAGDGIIVSEIEANRMIATVRSRSSSETSSYSSHSASSTDTSLCDENERGSDSEPEIPDDEKDKRNLNKYKNISSPSASKPSKNSHHLTKKEPVLLRTPDPDTKTTMMLDDKPIKNISEYLDSAAGEPLRTYIDGFESKLKDSLKITNDVTVFNPTNISPCSPRMTTERNEVLQRLNRTKYEENSASREITRPTSFTKSPNVFTELSPIDLSPCNCGVGRKSPYEYDFEKNFKRPPLNEPISRPPDIIDSFTMYPNFVPDIDLSDKNVSDFESPPGSPGGESIIVSEDEPPIPLKIDKYFEHSPEFFGARVTDPNSADIPNRRSTKRLSRLPKKPDSLTLQSNHNDKIIKEEAERASSLPQSHSFAKKTSEEYKEPDFIAAQKRETPETSKEERDIFSPKDYILQTGRKNSERALQIIQENSKILSRILTKQNITEVKSPTNYQVTKSDENVLEKQRNSYSKTVPEKTVESQLIESPLLKESTSDSLIGYRKRNINVGSTENNDFVRIRPISIDDPFSLEIRNSTAREEEFSIKHTKSPSSECLGNKTDLYGWENKGFLAKCDHKSFLDKTENVDFDYQSKTSDLSSYGDLSNKDLKPATTSEWTRHSFSGESRASVTLPSSEPKDTSTYEKRFTSDDYNYPFSSKYNDFVLSKASDICSKTVNQGPKVCENVSKTDNSQVSDFAHVVTSSISFTYEPSAEDDSPTGAKSNSSDTLCQITSLDQVSTPISPKIFPNRETPTIPKDYTEKSDRTKVESDDTCSAITSLIETDTLSSLSYPRSPSTGSYHPFPTRPVLRMPKELGVRLGMYPKDVINSPQK